MNRYIIIINILFYNKDIPSKNLILFILFNYFLSFLLNFWIRNIHISHKVFNKLYFQIYLISSTIWLLYDIKSSLWLYKNKNYRKIYDFRQLIMKIITYIYVYFLGLQFILFCTIEYEIVIKKRTKILLICISIEYICKDCTRLIYQYSNDVTKKDDLDIIKFLLSIATF